MARLTPAVTVARSTAMAVPTALRVTVAPTARLTPAVTVARSTAMAVPTALRVTVAPTVARTAGRDR
jgi:hypothetical protein